MCLSNFVALVTEQQLIIAYNVLFITITEKVKSLTLQVKACPGLAFVVAFGSRSSLFPCACPYYLPQFLPGGVLSLCFLCLPEAWQRGHQSRMTTAVGRAVLPVPWAGRSAGKLQEASGSGVPGLLSTDSSVPTCVPRTMPRPSWMSPGLSSWPGQGFSLLPSLLPASGLLL